MQSIKSRATSFWGCGNYHCGKHQISFYFKLMLPAFAELAVSALFGIVDSIMLGHTTDSAVNIAAAGFTLSPLNLLFAPMNAYCYGISAVVAQCIGAGDKKGAQRSTICGIRMAFGYGLVMSVLAVLCARPLFVLLGANDEIREAAIVYFRYFSAGFLFNAVNAAINSALRGVGITKIPMYYNIGSGLLNVFLNYCLIFGNLGMPEMGVAGAALATTLARFAGMVAAVLSLLFIKTPLKTKLFVSDAVDKGVSIRIFKIGIVSMIEQMLMQLGAVVTAKIISILPTRDYASFQIANSVESFLWSTGGAFNATSMTLSGQCTGQGQIRKRGAYARLGWICAMCFAFVASLCLIFLGKPISAVFTADLGLTAPSAEMLKYTAVSVFAIYTHLTLAGMLRGMGNARSPLIASLTSLWIFRVMLSFLLIRVLGNGIFAICLCLVCDQCVRAIIMFYLYHRSVIKHKKSAQ